MSAAEHAILTGVDGANFGEHADNGLGGGNDFAIAKGLLGVGQALNAMVDLGDEHVAARTGIMRKRGSSGNNSKSKSETSSKRPERVHVYLLNPPSANGSLDVSSGLELL